MKPYKVTPKRIGLVRRIFTSLKDDQGFWRVLESTSVENLGHQRFIRVRVTQNGLAIPGPVLRVVGEADAGSPPHQSPNVIYHNDAWWVRVNRYSGKSWGQVKPWCRYHKDKAHIAESWILQKVETVPNCPVYKIGATAEFAHPGIVEQHKPLEVWRKRERRNSIAGIIITDHIRMRISDDTWINYDSRNGIAFNAVEVTGCDLEAKRAELEWRRFKRIS